MSLAVTVLRAPVRVRTWRETAFVLASVPGAVLGLALVVLAAVGLAATPVAVGVPVLIAALTAVRWHAGSRRTVFRALLGRSWETDAATSGRATLTTAAPWRAIAYAATSAPVLLVGTYALLIALAGGMFLFTAPIWWWFSPTGVGLLDAGSFAATWYLVPSGIVAVLLAPWIARLVVLADGVLARWLLAADRTVVRVRALERARTDLVEDNAAALRRVERELHDGTQAALVAIGVTVTRARSRVAAARRDPSVAADRLPEAEHLLEQAAAAVTDAVDQLRDIVRRIHPPALDDGLDVAVRTLAARSGLPVRAEVAVPGPVPPGPATVVYFAAAELLTNVARHADATHVELDLARPGPVLSLTVADDGRGGAIENGAAGHTGLAGLRRRIEAVDGTMDVDSPAGGPTRIRVQVPVDGGR